MVAVAKPSAAAPAHDALAATGSVLPEKAAVRTGLGPAEPAPKPGEIYLQIGAVERGFAEIVVAGLRSRGYASVLAPSPSDKIFRVLIGPLQDGEAVTRTKAELEAAGLNFFARRYEVEASPAPQVSAVPQAPVATAAASTNPAQ
jgi:cell division septation protein DedD